jgi:hypothetical protein
MSWAPASTASGTWRLRGSGVYAYHPAGELGAQAREFRDCQRALRAWMEGDKENHEVNRPTARPSWLQPAPVNHRGSRKTLATANHTPSRPLVAPPAGRRARDPAASPHFGGGGASPGSPASSPGLPGSPQFGWRRTSRVLRDV